MRKAKKSPKFDPIVALDRMIELKHILKEHPEHATTKEEKEFHSLLKILTKEFAPLLSTLAAAGLLTTFCWDEAEGMAAFEVGSVSAEAGLGIALHCEDVVFYSDPSPKFGFEDEGIDLAKIKLDKKNPN